MTKIDAKRCYPANTDGSVRKNNSFRGSILFLFGVSLTLSPAFAQAQEFDIDAGPAVIALSEFAAQADVSIVYTYDAVDGLETNRVEGVYEPNQALNLLLAGTSLSAYEGDGGAFAVSVREERGDSESKNLETVTPILMAQNQTSPAATESSRSEEGGTSIVTGKVTDARTGANLKGAKVTIEETGQWTSTNDLGEFRFVNVPTGSATLTVSYLGYAGQSAVVGVRGDGTSQDFALNGGEIDEIVVFGERSARAIALNRERTTENVSTIVTADLLGNFTGTTISDSLRRLPGVAFQRNVQTGDGANIIVRGIEPDLNAVKFNGIELPESTGEGRSASLNSILADSISSVTINKTLLPSHDSSGTGALIEIETRSPLDSPENHLRFSAEGGGIDNDLVDEELYSATGGLILGDDRNFGINVSIQSRQRDVTRVGYGLDLNFAEYLPLDEGGNTGITSTSQIDPRLFFPFTQGADRAHVTTATNNVGIEEIDDLGVTVSAQWRVQDHTDLRLDYQLIETERSSFGADATLFTFGSYSEIPVQSLGGQNRQAFTLADFFSPTHGYTYREVKQSTDVLSLRGKSELGSWTFDYSAGYTDGESETPISGSFGFFTDFSTRPTLGDAFVGAGVDLSEGRVISLWNSRSGRGFPVPNFTVSGLEYMNSADNYSLNSSAFLSENYGGNERAVLELGARRDLRGTVISYVEVGIDYERSEFFNRPGQTSTTFSLARPALASDVGFVFDNQIFGSAGINDGFAVASANQISSFVRQFDTLSQGANPLFSANIRDTNELTLQSGSEETDVAPYFQTQVEFGKFQIIGGLRFSSVEVEATNRYSISFRDADGVRDNDFRDRHTQLATENHRQESWLPRILVNYRIDDQTIIRAGYFSTIARPEIRQLSQFSSISVDLRSRYGPDGNQPRVLYNVGNPELKPAETHNFDVSFERFLGNVGVYKIGLFYKEIENPFDVTVDQPDGLPDGVRLPDDPLVNDLPTNTFYEGFRPINNDQNGFIWGIEVAVEQPLDFLAKRLSDFSVYANVTHTQSEIDQPFVWQRAPVYDDGLEIVGFESRDLIIEDREFQSSPEWSGTLGMTYTSERLDGSLYYTWQDRTLPRGFTAGGLSSYIEDAETLDGRLSYRFDNWGPFAGFVYLEGINLLKGRNDPDSEEGIGGVNGVPTFFTVGRYLGGRSFRVGFTAEF